MLRCNVEKPGISYVLVRLLRRRTEEHKFNQLFYVNLKLDEILYILDVMNFVYDKVIANELLCNVL